jgi:hypothetical protein
MQDVGLQGAGIWDIEDGGNGKGKCSEYKDGVFQSQSYMGSEKKVYRTLVLRE